MILCHVLNERGQLVPLLNPAGYCGGYPLQQQPTPTTQENRK